MGFQVFRGAAVVVPVGVVELHKPRAAFDEPPGQQAVASVGRFSWLLDPVEAEGLGGFAGDVGELRGAGLHAEGHLVAGDAGGDLGVTGVGQPLLIELPHRIDHAALACLLDALGCGEIEDRVASVAKGNALIRTRQAAAAPEQRAAAWPPRAALQYHKAWQVGRLAAEAVGDPAAHARPAKLTGARVHEELGRGVVEEVG